jgi:hypothetical protein
VLSAGPGEVELSVQPLARDHEAYTLTITPANIKLSAGGLAGRVAHPPIILVILVSTGAILNIFFA